jgi:hypothetical protein
MKYRKVWKEKQNRYEQVVLTHINKQTGVKVKGKGKVVPVL